MGHFVLLQSLLVLVGEDGGDLIVEECPPLGESPHAQSQTMAASDVVIRTTDAMRHIILVMRQVSWLCPHH